MNMHPAAAVLYRFTHSGAVDIVSRGSEIDILGVKATYIGVAPNGDAYFWRAAGEAKCLSLAIMQAEGFAFHDYRKGGLPANPLKAGHAEA